MFVFYMVGCDYGYHFFEDMVSEEEYGLGFADGFGYGYEYGTGTFGNDEYNTDGNYLNTYHSRNGRGNGDGLGYGTVTRDGLGRTKGFK